MTHLKRSEFLKKAALLVAGVIVLPKFAFALSSKKTVGPLTDRLPDDADFSIHEGAIIDMHSHPSLKMYLLNKKMWQKHHPGKGPNILRMQEDLDQYRSGYVKGFMGTHYLVEGSIEKDWDLVKALWPWINRLLHKIADKLEKETPENFVQVNTMMDILETQLDKCNGMQKDLQFLLCKDFASFDAALHDPAKKTIPYAHAIEGAHALGRNFPISKKQQLEEEGKPTAHHLMIPGNDPADASRYIENLRAFAARGTAMMALSHFFKNDLAYPVDGISPDEKKVPQMTWQYTPDQNWGLTPIGEAVVREMLDIGMVVDLTHSTPQVRADAFRINQEITNDRRYRGYEPRPLIFSHTGAQVIYDEYDQNHYPYYKYYAVSDEEIRLIEECNGVIGVVCENFWLVGADTELDTEFWPEQFKNGIPYIIQTMKYINSQTYKQDFSHVGLGTDFDGLADAPADLYCNSQLKDLVQAMKADAQIAPYVEKIMSGNARRILEYGWGPGKRLP